MGEIDIEEADRKQMELSSVLNLIPHLETYSGINEPTILKKLVDILEDKFTYETKENKGAKRVKLHKFDKLIYQKS
jgi:hypothetical protein